MASRPEVERNRWWSRVSGAVRLTRPVNCLLSALSILVAAAIAASPIPWPPVLAAMLSAVCITAAANAINDWYDAGIDAINRPDRPLPSGAISPHFALSQARILFVCGLFISIFISIPAVLIAGVSICLLVLYSARLKKTALWGNLAVSGITGVAFLYGAIAAGNGLAGWTPAAFAFLFHLGREILKDLEDMPGDAALGARTFPIVYGRRAAVALITAVYAGLILLTFLPGLTGEYGTTYFLIVVPGVDLFLAGLLIALWSDDSPKRLRLYRLLLKADMAVGLLALYAGKLRM